MSISGASSTSPRSESASTCALSFRRTDQEALDYCFFFWVVRSPAMVLPAARMATSLSGSTRSSAGSSALLCRGFRPLLRDHCRCWWLYPLYPRVPTWMERDCSRAMSRLKTSATMGLIFPGNTIICSDGATCRDVRSRLVFRVRLPGPLHAPPDPVPSAPLDFNHPPVLHPFAHFLEVADWCNPDRKRAAGTDVRLTTSRRLTTSKWASSAGIQRR